MNQSHRVIIINQAFADTFVAGEEALGEYLRFSGVLDRGRDWIGTGRSAGGDACAWRPALSDASLRSGHARGRAGLFAVVAMGAVYWPARQAARLDPVVMLPHD